MNSTGKSNPLPDVWHVPETGNLGGSSLGDFFLYHQGYWGGNDLRSPVAIVSRLMVVGAGLALQRVWERLAEVVRANLVGVGERGLLSMR